MSTCGFLRIPASMPRCSGGRTSDEAVLARSSGRGRPRFGPVDHQPALGEEPLAVLLDEFVEIADGRDARLPADERPCQNDRQIRDLTSGAARAWTARPGCRP